MTAEIAVMNEEAVALAADSAVTAGPKIFTSANKIFALSKYHPIGVMIYDSAQFLGVPWETIIKEYRHTLGTKSFATLKDQADHFLAYFDGRNPLFVPDAQSRAVNSMSLAIFNEIRREAMDSIQEKLSEGELLNDDEVAAEFRIAVDKEFARWSSDELAPGIPKSHLGVVSKKYRPEIDRAMADVFQETPLSPGSIRRLRSVVARSLTRKKRFENNLHHSGIVVAGFGKEDVFPRLFAYDFEVLSGNRLKYAESSTSPVEIGPGNTAGIVPFAQSEQVHTFIRGLDPQISSYQETWWRDKLKAATTEIADELKVTGKSRQALLKRAAARRNEILEEYENAIDGIQGRHYIMPILNVLAMLPKDELAAMAESLVNLTSFKRRVTQERETVGGPIDVAVISRGDGFIWIKRKHYFTPDLNPQFLANYYRKDTDD